MSDLKQQTLIDRRQLFSRVSASGFAVGVASLANALGLSPINNSKNNNQSSTATPRGSEELGRGHICWMHPFWTRPEKDFDARRWIDQFQQAGFKSFIFYAKFHDGACTWPSKLQPIKPLRDFLGEISSEAHRRNMKIVTYYSVGPDDAIADQKPDWRIVRRDGSSVPTPTPAWKYGYPCLNSPYREYVLGQIDEILATYDVDGIWLDILEFPAGGCYCRYCREKYSARTGGESLFNVDGTLVQMHWQADCLNDVFRAAKQITRKYGAEKTITYNGSGHLRADLEWAGHEIIDKEVDYFTVEGWAVASHQIGLICRLIRSLGKPYEILIQVSGRVLGWTPRITDRVLLEAITVAAHGGTYAACLDATAAGQIFEYQVNQLTSVSSYVEQRREWLVNTKPVYDVALFFPTYLAGPREKASTPWARLTTGWADLLIERQIPTSYLYPDNPDLSQFQLLVLDRSFPPSDNLVEQVAEFVRAGGSILAELTAEQVASRAGQRLLDEVLGVHLLGSTGYPAQFIGGLDTSIASGIPNMPFLIDGPAYKVQPTTSAPLAYYEYPIAPWSLDRMTYGPFNPPSSTVSGDPAVTLNRYGKGLAMYVAFPLGAKEVARHKNVIGETGVVHEFALQLGENLALRLVLEPLLRSEAPTGVEIVMNEQPKRHLVHLLNNLIHPMVYSESRGGNLALADVSFSVNEKRVGPIRQVVSGDGTELPMKRNGKWLRITVPRLKVHEVLALVH